MSADFKNYSIATGQGNISVWDTGGQGNPVVFIHGNSANGRVFSKQFDQAGKYRYIALDLPGHGSSDKAKDPEGTYNFEGYSLVVAEVIKKLELSKPTIVGWSLGGHIALCLINKIQNLAGILITGTPPIKVSPEGFQSGFMPITALQSLFGKVEFSKEEACSFMAPSGIDPDKYPFIVEAALKTDGYARHYLVQSIGLGVGGDQKTLVEENSTPLCVVQGELDKGINNKYVIEQVRYKKLFQDKVHLVKNSGHSVFWEKPEEFNDILSQFLAHVSPIQC